MNTNRKAYYYEEEGLMVMPTFDEILTDNGYHCEYYGKWHSQISKTSIYRNPKQSSLDGHSVFAHGGQKYVHWDYLDEHVPMSDVKLGELYDTMTKRPYKTDPIDQHHGMTAVDLKASKEKFAQNVMHGALQIPKEHTLTAFQAKETIEAIERLKDTTFSITCSFHFPHPPMLPPEPYYDMYPADEMVPPESILDEMDNSPYQTANRRLKHTEYSDPEKIKFMI
jgi:hypothetical protein